MTEEAKVISIEPTWESLIPSLIRLICEGGEHRKTAEFELYRMARLCDRVRQTQKRGVEMVRILNPIHQKICEDCGNIFVFKRKAGKRKRGQIFKDPDYCITCAERRLI
jgi:uncharacterized protein YlaI